MKIEMFKSGYILYLRFYFGLQSEFENMFHYHTEIQTQITLYSIRNH